MKHFKQNLITASGLLIFNSALFYSYPTRMSVYSETEIILITRSSRSQKKVMSEVRVQDDLNYAFWKIKEYFCLHRDFYRHKYVLIYWKSIPNLTNSKTRWPLYASARGPASSDPSPFCLLDGRWRNAWQTIERRSSRRWYFIGIGITRLRNRRGHRKWRHPRGRWLSALR